jgi:hypothetical protein
MHELSQIIKEVTKELEQVPERAKERNNMKPSYTGDKKIEIVTVTTLNIVGDKTIVGLIKLPVEKGKLGLCQGLMMREWCCRRLS